MTNHLPSAQFWVEKLGLQSYGSGGYFRETYRAAESLPGEALPERFGAPHTFSTAIYFLLEGQQVSPLHRLKADEMWHYYAGVSLTIHIFGPEGAYTALDLGPRIEQGESFQVVAPAGCWFGATLKQADAYILAGCTVAPGFEVNDYTPADRATLLAQYPEQRVLIERLTS